MIDLLGNGGVEIVRDAHLSTCGRYRWTLTRHWVEPCAAISRVVWLMLNPSTADHTVDDPTVRRCIHFTRAWDYDGLTIVNLFPFRSPSPEACRRWSDWESRSDWDARDALLTNQRHVQDEITRAPIVIAAWGAHPWANDHAEEMLNFLDVPGGFDLDVIDTSGRGRFPKHPMARGKHRVPDDAKPTLWRAFR